MDNDYNRDRVLGFFTRNKCAYSVANVNICIEQLSSELQWAVWAPRLQPVDATPLIEGTQEKQLPLDASEQVMRRASKAQLQDLSRRQGDWHKSRKGNFGVSFVEPTF